MGEKQYQESKSKIKQLTKQLSVVRKKIEEFEAKFEDAHGYRPSQAEKQSNKEVRKMILQQNRLKRQIRICRESGDSGINVEDLNNPSPVMSPTRPWSPSCTDFSSLLNVYSDSSNECTMSVHGDRGSLILQIQEKFDKERRVSGRPEILEEMTADQVLQEKNSIQLALNQVQTCLNMHNEATDEERNVLKDLLLRYRTVKRLIRRSSNALIKDPCELETIPEGSEIQLTLASPQHRINIEMNGNNPNPKAVIDQAEMMPANTSSKSSDEHNSLPKETPESEDNEPNLHAMSR